MALSLVEGWTEDIDYTLDVDGTAQSLSGWSVELEAVDSKGSTISLAGSATIADAASGTVRFSPSANDIRGVNSPMLIRWKMTDASAKVSYFPNDSWERWTIRK